MTELIRKSDALAAIAAEGLHILDKAIATLPAVTVAVPTDDTQLLLDAYKGLLVLHRMLDKVGLTAGVKATNSLADRIVAAHPEFPALAALRAIGEPPNDRA